MSTRHHKPFGMVLLDVNGTLVPSHPGGRTDPRSMGRVRSLAQQLASGGVAVGLCSDSPLEQLWEFGHGIGLGEVAGFPVVAENGNVVAVDGSVQVIVSFPAREHIRGEVAAVAAGHRLGRIEDVTAPEFGGHPPSGRQWAFGANRRASISVFGPPDFIHHAHRHLTAWIAAHRAGAAVEISPARTYAGIHPYAHIAQGKRTAMAHLTRSGSKRTLLVGNSLADWVPDVDNVRCAFVADTAVPQHVRNAAWYTSPKADLEGVIDILGHVIRRQPSPAAAQSQGSEGAGTCRVSG